MPINALFVALEKPLNIAAREFGKIILNSNPLCYKYHKYLHFILTHKLTTKNLKLSFIA
jgi:hypothetical protein